MNQALIDVSQVMPLAVATGLFISLATVQQATNTLDATGQVDLTDSGFATIAGCANIACMRAPLSFNSPTANEQDTPEKEATDNQFHLLLDDYYPQIPEAAESVGDLRVIIDGITHTVDGVEFDSQKTQTRIHCRQEAV